MPSVHSKMSFFQKISEDNVAIGCIHSNIAIPSGLKRPENQAISQYFIPTGNEHNIKLKLHNFVFLAAETNKYLGWTIAVIQKNIIHTAITEPIAMTRTLFSFT